MTWLGWLWRRGNRAARWARLKDLAPPPAAGDLSPRPTVQAERRSPDTATTSPTPPPVHPSVPPDHRHRP